MSSFRHPAQKPSRRATADADAITENPSAAPTRDAPTWLVCPTLDVPPVRRYTSGESSTVDAPMSDPLGGAPIPSSVLSVLRRSKGGGRPLPATVADPAGQVLQRDLSTVRVHTDTEADQVARSVQSVAFTHGEDIYFSAGSYNTGTDAGAHLVAHELAHVGQRADGHSMIGRADDPAEAAADRTAAHIVPALRRSMAMPGRTGQPAAPTSHGASANSQLSRSDTSPVLRKYNMKRNKRLGLQDTVLLETMPNNPVMFATDSTGDRVAIKLEKDPIGLAQLAAGVHQQIGGNRSVVSKKLPDSERAELRTIVADPNIAKGESWSKKGGNLSHLKKSRADFADDASYGRAIVIDSFDGEHLKNAPAMAMTMADGKAARDLTNTEFALDKTPDTAPFKTVLETPWMVRQLGELAAIDLFLGNGDRLDSPNLGNWFYNPSREITLIDHVDDKMNAAWKANTVETELLQHLATSELPGQAKHVGSMMRAQIKAEIRDMAGKKALDAYYKENPSGGKTRIQEMDDYLLEGMQMGRKHILKTFESKWNKNSSYRSKKKAIKKQAKAADRLDDSASIGDGTDYYSILKQRAAWLKVN